MMIANTPSLNASTRALSDRRADTSAVAASRAGSRLRDVVVTSAR
jgi:hypothetical protein